MTDDRDPARRDVMRSATKCFKERFPDHDDTIYLNGEEFADRTPEGDDRLRHLLYEQKELSGAQIESREEDGDLYVTTLTNDTDSHE